MPKTMRWARVEGQPAQNPSFWIRSEHFTQAYQKNGAYWFPVSTTSISEAKIFGKTEVRISYFDYSPGSKRTNCDPNPALAEVRYVKH